MNKAIHPRTPTKAPQIQIGTEDEVSEKYAITGTIQVITLVQAIAIAFPVARAADGNTSGVYAYNTA